MRVWLKRIGYVFGAVVALVVIAVSAVYGMSEMRFRRTYSVPMATVAVSDDSATLARGQHITTAISGCTECHGQGLGGGVMVDAAPLGRLVAPNLTPGDGGLGAILTPEIIERALRHGVGPDGRALRVMPAQDFQYMSDEDTRAVVSYVRHLAPVNNVLAPTNLMLLPRALMLANKMPLLPAEEIGESQKSMSVPFGPTVEYGDYLSLISGCRGCHGPQLSGGKIAAGDPSWGPAVNLTRAGNLGKWTEAEFVKTIRTGVRPDGIALKSPMPWKRLRNMTDDELHAIWLYLQSVPPRAFGNH
ncbi:MAG TPA: cytochrome c [Gemmatimonadaceae bacterium]|nr:cytochrome c [Gemmatimonadaceae bacterium]